MAFRTVLRSPVPVANACIVVAIGIGVTLTTALVIDGLSWRAPHGVTRPGQLLSVMASDADGERPQLLTYRAFKALEDTAQELDLFAWSNREVQVAHAGRAGVWTAALVSGRYFSALGTAARAGRLLTSVDSAQPLTAVVSSRLADTIASNSESAPGASLRINGKTFTVVGVAARGFHGLEAGDPADVWIPVTAEPLIAKPLIAPDGQIVADFLSLPVGFLRGGLRVPDGLAGGGIQPQLTRAYQSAEPARGSSPDRRRILLASAPWLTPFRFVRALIDAVVQPLVAGAALSLLLTAVCLASVLGAAWSDRRSEYCIRVALGATPFGLLRLMAVELAFILTVGSTLAFLLTKVVLRLAQGLQILPGFRIGDLVTDFDARALGLLVLIALVVGAASGWGPALLALRGSQRSNLADAHGGTAGRRTRRFLIAAQVALGCGLLSGALLLTRSIDAIVSQPIGFDPESVAYVRLDPVGAGLTPGRSLDLGTRLRETLLSDGVPAALADALPLAADGAVRILAEDSAWGARMRTAPLTRAGDGYFEVMGIAVRLGRPFGPLDRDRRVAVISEPLAEQLYPGRSAIGHSLTLGGPRGPRYDIVGVVAGVRDRSLLTAASGRLYIPYDESAESLCVLARMTPGSSAIPSLLAQRARDLDSRLAVMEAGSLRGLVSDQVGQRRLLQAATATVGVGSIVMVIVAVSGLTHESVRRRRREFGVRAALGAPRRALVRLGYTDAGFVAMVGCPAGVLLSWLVGGLLETWLFGITASAPGVYALSVLPAGTAVLVGAARPAQLAATVNPRQLLSDS